MPMKTAVQCPSERCGIVFEPPARWLGRNMYCPACGVRMTARPLEVCAELDERRDRLPGGRGAETERLPFVVIVDNVRSLWNVGAIFRTADACGVRKLVLSGITGCPPRPEITKTALGAEETVAWDYRADPLRALHTLADEGYRPVALEHTSRAAGLDELDWPEQVCLVIGNEVAGISPPVIEACDLHATIPMLGVKESLNVSVAFGIAAYRVASVLSGRNRT
jgi:tRNA G18 (ribose-2'-O)-methylase SpoU